MSDIDPFGITAERINGRFAFTAGKSEDDRFYKNVLSNSKIVYA